MKYFLVLQGYIILFSGVIFLNNKSFILIKFLGIFLWDLKIVIYTFSLFEHTISFTQFVGLSLFLSLFFLWFNKWIFLMCKYDPIQKKRGRLHFNDPLEPSCKCLKTSPSYMSLCGIMSLIRGFCPKNPCFMKFCTCSIISLFNSKYWVLTP